MVLVETVVLETVWLETAVLETAEAVPVRHYLYNPGRAHDLVVRLSRLPLGQPVRPPMTVLQVELLPKVVFPM